MLLAVDQAIAKREAKPGAESRSSRRSSRELGRVDQDLDSPAPTTTTTTTSTTIRPAFTSEPCKTTPGWRMNNLDRRCRRISTGNDGVVLRLDVEADRKRTLGAALRGQPGADGRRVSRSSALRGGSWPAGASIARLREPQKAAPLEKELTVSFSACLWTQISPRHHVLSLRPYSQARLPVPQSRTVKGQASRLRLCRNVS